MDLKDFTIRNIRNVCERKRICKVEEIGKLKLYRFENGIIVVNTKADYAILRKAGDLIPLGTPWIVVDGEEIVHDKDLLLVEDTKEEFYVAIAKEFAKGRLRGRKKISSDGKD